MMKQAFAAAVLALSTAHIFAADLFQDGKLRPINSGDLIVATDTIGGYPIFQDDGRWKFASGKESASTGGVSAIKMGSALLDYYQGTYLLARQSLFASLDVGGQNNFWTGSPCSIGHRMPHTWACGAIRTPNPACQWRRRRHRRRHLVTVCPSKHIL